MSDRGLQEIPAFVILGGLVAVVSAASLGLDPHNAKTVGWLAAWMIGPWLLFTAVMQLDWYRKHGEWL